MASNKVDLDESSFPTTSAEDAARIIVDGIEDEDPYRRGSRVPNDDHREPGRSPQAAHLIYRKMKDLLP